MWTLASRWFDVAVLAALYAALTVAFRPLRAAQARVAAAVEVRGAARALARAGRDPRTHARLRRSHRAAARGRRFPLRDHVEGRDQRLDGRATRPVRRGASRDPNRGRVADTREAGYAQTSFFAVRS